MKYPLKYEDLESALLKQNRLLKLHLATVSLIMGLLCLMVWTQRLFFTFEAGPLMKERALLEDVCKEAFKEIKDKQMSAHVIHSELISLIEKEEFKWSEAEVLRVASPTPSHCHLVFKIAGKLHSFNLVFDGNDANPFFYRLIEINELEDQS